MTARENAGHTVACIHCAVSMLLMERQKHLPLTLEDACLLGQVLADIVGSVPPADRGHWGREVKREIGQMLDMAIAGHWHAGARR